MVGESAATPPTVSQRRSTNPVGPSNTHGSALCFLPLVYRPSAARVSSLPNHHPKHSDLVVLLITASCCAGCLWELFISINSVLPDQLQQLLDWIAGGNNDDTWLAEASLLPLLVRRRL